MECRLNWRREVEVIVAPLDNSKGVWKSGKGKGRKTPKGRQLEDQAHSEVLDLIGDQPRNQIGRAHV